MIILLNGPLGIGKSTLSVALVERLEQCVMLDGDYLVALNPSPINEVDYFHTTLELLVSHHRKAGYQHFVINHYWSNAEDIHDLRARLQPVGDAASFCCFLLTLPEQGNRRRVEQRQVTRAIDERDFERETLAAERSVLYSSAEGQLGELFDVSAEPAVLVELLLKRIGLA